MQLTDLEIHLRRGSDGGYCIDLRIRRHDSAIDRDLVIGAPVLIDVNELREVFLDTQEYGYRLTRMIFGSPQLREAWATVQGFLDGLGSSIRFRLKIDPAVEDMHSVRWEALCDPIRQFPICRSERFVFSRYIEAGELARITTRDRHLSKALIAIANPSDLEKFNLSPIEGSVELNRIRSALGQSPCTVLVSGIENGPVTLERICSALNDDCAILYLVCHGTLIGGTSYLWLEHEDGTSVRVPGMALVEFIQGLAPERRPMLAVLGSCQSSGDGLAPQVLSALGPQLARAGVGAVIGMQGNVPVATIERLMPRFFTFLQAEGEVDRALARARSELGRDHPWWMPVLYMRVRDGAIWSEAVSQPLPVADLEADSRSSPMQLGETINEYVERMESRLIRDFRQDHFVMLSVEAVSSTDNETLGAIQHALRGSFDIQVMPKVAKGGTPLPIASTVSNHRRVILLGSPGIGKTTSLRFIALEQMRAFYARESVVAPVWVSLNRWRDPELSALEFIYSEFLIFAGDSLVSLQEFENLLYEGKFLLLLDGLNEIPQRKLKTSRHDEQMEELDIEQKELIPDRRENSLFMLARHSKSKFVISCRILEYTSSPGWYEFLVLPLNEQQVEEFVVRHLGAESDYFDTMMAQQPRLKALTTTPFYLMSLLALAQERLSWIPRDRFEIIQYMCRALLMREATKREVSPEFADSVQQLLGQGACDSMQKGYFGTNVHFQPDEDEVNMLAFAEKAGLIIPSWSDSRSVAYRYLHQLVQEALALSHLRLKLPAVEHTAAASLSVVGNWHLRWGKMKEAQENYLRAQELCPTVGFEQLRAGVLLGLSRLYRRWWNSAEALTYAEALIELGDTLGVSEELADAYHELGLVYHHRNRLKEAEKSFYKALKICGELGDVRKKAFELRDGLANFYDSPKVYRIPQALTLYDQAVNIFLDLNDEISLQWTKLSIAQAHRLFGNMKQAETIFQEIVDHTADDKKQIGLRLQALQWMGYNSRDTHEYDKAQKYLEEALVLARELRSDREFSILTYGLGWIAIHQNKFARARELLTEALTLSHKLISPYPSISIYFHLGYCEYKAKKFIDAAKYWRQYAQAIDDEYRLSMGPTEKLAVRFSDYVGNRNALNWIQYTIAALSWHLTNIFFKVNTPIHPLGVWTWRLFWWSHKF